MVSNIGHISGALHLNPLVTLSKNAGPFFPAIGSVYEIGMGWYALSGNADDRNILGDLIIHAESPTADMTDEKGKIVSYDPFITPTSDGNSDEINILSSIYNVLKNLNNFNVPKQGIIP